ncbi:MAG: hypothetical protein JNM06_05270 [Blastocatellia bacterium]|nr:hypothetical protein [Blastocatellia bacterium]
MARVKVVQIWEHITTKLQIRVLDIANKIVVAETLPNKTPVFLTSIDLEQNYKMIRIENKPNQ